MPRRAADGTPTGDPGDTPPQPPLTRPTPLRRPQKAPDGGYVAVGRILAPFGLKGEVKVQSLTDNPERLRAGSKIYAGLQPLTIASARQAGGFTYLTFKGYTDRTTVDELRHRMLQISESDLPPLPEGEYYRFQLIGLTATDRNEAALGTVAEVIETGANDVLRIERPDLPELLVPLLDTTVLEVNLVERRIILDPPDWR